MRRARCVPRTRLLPGLALTCELLLGGCTQSAEEGILACRRIHGSEALEIELLFGRDIGGRAQVSDVQWSQFLQVEVTSRFPQGLTVLTASGQWRDAQSGQITQEPSFIVQIVAPDSVGTLERLTQIRLAYEHRFEQQSVGLTIVPICSSF